MKQPLKMHRPTSVIAAVLMILPEVLSIAVLFSDPSAYSWPFLVGSALIAVALSVILFRGRKDAAAGVIFFIAGIVPLLSGFFVHLAVVIVMESILLALLCLLSGLVEAAFLGLAAGECWSEGNISVGNGRVLLWLLPVLCFCIELWEQMLLCCYNGMAVRRVVTDSLIYVIPQWLGPILMGVSLSVPEKIEDF